MIIKMGDKEILLNATIYADEVEIELHNKSIVRGSTFILSKRKNVQYNCLGEQAIIEGNLEVHRPIKNHNNEISNNRIKDCSDKISIVG